MNDYDDRLRRIEERLGTIEARLSIATSAPSPAPSPKATPTPLPISTRPTPIPSPTAPSSRAGLSATTVLGWGGVAALVLATAYLIRLAIDSGWLTPVRQVGMAGIFGVGLIATGLFLRDTYRRYGSLLPAGGIAVLFLTVYGAHLYHNLISAIPAVVGIIAICLASLALREHYKNELYTFFAVIGSFTGPHFLHILAARPVDLAIYFGAWDLLFCIYAIRAGWRSVYLVSAYLAFIVFDATWRSAEHTDWIWAAGFQAAQFLVFTAATIVYSLKHRFQLKEHEAVLHLPPLLFFYAVEYGLLYRHIPEVTPWLALASIVPLLLGYAIGQSRLIGKSQAGEQIVTVYTAVVLLHAGYVELLPDGWGALVGLIATVALTATLMTRHGLLKRYWPIALALGIIASIGYARLLIGYELEDVLGWRLLIPTYAAILYTAYWMSRSRTLPPIALNAALYLAHWTVMAGIVHLTDSHVVISIVWGLLAVTALIVSIISHDRGLGRSSLLVFAAFAAKVLLFDLSGTATLVRIGCLVVLGVTLYVGGMLYQKIEARA